MSETICCAHDPENEKPHCVWCLFQEGRGSMGPSNCLAYIKCLFFFYLNSAYNQEKPLIFCLLMYHSKDNHVHSVSKGV